MFLQKVNSINVLLYKDHHVHKQLSVIISIEWRRRFINYRSLILDKNFQITSLQENKDKLLIVNFSLFKCSSISAVWKLWKKNKVHIRVYLLIYTTKTEPWDFILDCILVAEDRLDRAEMKCRRLNHLLQLHRYTVYSP